MEPERGFPTTGHLHLYVTNVPGTELRPPPYLMVHIALTKMAEASGRRKVKEYGNKLTGSQRHALTTGRLLPRPSPPGQLQYRTFSIDLDKSS
jgi:hypothetical protein